MFAILRREGSSEMRFSPRPEQGEGTSHVAIQNKMFQTEEQLQRLQGRRGTDWFVKSKVNVAVVYTLSLLQPFPLCFNPL